MTILWGDTGLISYGTLREISFSYPTMRETSNLSITLPTTEPVIPQISYIVQQDDLVTFSGMSPISYDIIPILYVNGQIGSVSTTLNYRMLLNDVSIVQSSSTNQSANAYFTYTFHRYLPVNVGDKISISIWSNQADTVLNYHSFTTLLTRMQLAPMNALLKDVKYGVGIAQPTYAQSPTPVFVASTQSYLVLPSNLVSSAITMVINPTNSYTMYAMMQDPTYKSGRINYGDAINSVTIALDPANKFRPYRNWMPTTISFREIR